MTQFLEFSLIRSLKILFFTFCEMVVRRVLIHWIDFLVKLLSRCSQEQLIYNGRLKHDVKL